MKATLCCYAGCKREEPPDKLPRSIVEIGREIASGNVPEDFVMFGILECEGRAYTIGNFRVSRPGSKTCGTAGTWTAGFGWIFWVARARTHPSIN
jgi:hypothetical protein